MKAVAISLSAALWKPIPQAKADTEDCSEWTDWTKEAMSCAESQPLQQCGTRFVDNENIVEMVKYMKSEGMNTLAVFSAQQVSETIQIHRPFHLLNFPLPPAPAKTRRIPLRQRGLDDSRSSVSGLRAVRAASSVEAAEHRRKAGMAKTSSSAKSAKPKPREHKRNTEAMVETTASDPGQRSAPYINEKESDEVEPGKEAPPKSIAIERKNTSDAGINTLQTESPVTRDFEAQVHEAKETERNLKASREATLPEMPRVDETVGDTQLGLNKRLRELEHPIAGSHSENRETQERFRGFVGTINSGDTQDKKQARSTLGGINQFCSTLVAVVLRACRGVVANVTSFVFKMMGGT